MNRGRHFAVPQHFEPACVASARQGGDLRMRLCTAGLAAMLGLALTPAGALATEDVPDAGWNPDVPSIDTGGSTGGETGGDTSSGGEVVDPAPELPPDTGGDTSGDTGGGDASGDVPAGDGGGSWGDTGTGDLIDAGSTPDYVPSYEETYGGGDTSSVAASPEAFADPYATTSEVVAQETVPEEEAAVEETVAAPVITGWSQADRVLSGTAVPGATVQAYDAAGTLVAEAVAGEDGTFSIALPEGYDLSSVNLVTLGFDGGVSAATTGASFAETLAAQERARVASEVAVTVGSLADSIDADLSSSGLYASYEQQSSSLPVLPYVLGAGVGVVASGVAVGAFMGIRHAVTGRDERADDSDEGAMVADVRPFFTAPSAPVRSERQAMGMATSQGSDDDELERLAMAFASGESLDAASAPAQTSAPAAASHVVPAPGADLLSDFDYDPDPQGPGGKGPDASSTLDDADKFSTAAFLRAADVPSVRPSSTDVTGASAATWGPGSAAGSVSRASLSGAIPHVEDLLGFDVFEPGSVSGLGEEGVDPLASADDWRALAYAELARGVGGASERSSITSATMPRTPSATMASKTNYFAPVVGPSTPSRVAPLLQDEEKRARIEKILAMQQTLAGQVQATSSGARVADPARPAPAAASRADGVPQIQRGTSAYAGMTSAVTGASSRLNCVVPEIGDLDSSLYAPTVAMEPVRVAAQVPVAAAASRPSFSVPAVYSADEQLPATDMFTYDPSIYETSPLSPAYIDYLVKDEFEHRHDSPAQRAAATGQFQVIEGTGQMHVRHRARHMA